MLLNWWTKKILSGKAQRHLRSRVETSNRNSSWTYWPLKMRLLHFLRIQGSIYPLMHHHVLRAWNPYHLQNQLTLWSRVIPKNCGHCTSPYKSLLPAGYMLTTAPRMDSVVSATMMVHVEQCIQCHPRRLCDQSHNNYVTLTPNICKTCRFIPQSLDPT